MFRLMERCNALQVAQSSRIEEATSNESQTSLLTVNPISNDSKRRVSNGNGDGEDDDSKEVKSPATPGINWSVPSTQHRLLQWYLSSSVYHRN
jgi:hypothetical protein